MKNNKILEIEGKLIKNGIRIIVAGRNFDVIWPEEIWENLSSDYKEILLDNITFADTQVLGLIFDSQTLKYNTSIPFLESYLFQNQLYDMTFCEKADNVKQLSYLKDFYNTDYVFDGKDSKMPDFLGMKKFKKGKKKIAIIPFTFGKESLTTLALCLELGIEPILVYSQEPMQKYEEEYKRKLLNYFAKKYKIKTYFIENGPGLFRSDAAFSLKPNTEIGWGTQTTVLAIKMMPFVFYHNASYIFLGSEFSNNEFEMENGWRVVPSADQTSAWTKQQNNIVRLLSGGQCELKASLEPLEESFIFYMLHHRYPEMGKYQFSCTAEKPLLKNSQWCHDCYKCTRMFLFAKAFGIDYKKVGFTKDLFDKKGLYKNYFDGELKTGSNNELDFAFFQAYRRGVKSMYIDKFKKMKLAKIKKWEKYFEEFTNINPYMNLPKEFEDRLLKIFKEEFEDFKKDLI